MENNRDIIIIVDDSILNLRIGRDVLKDKYDIFTVTSGQKLLKLLEKVIPNLILLDIEMPEMNGYDTIKILKDNKKTADIPVIFLTAKNDIGSELTGFNLGAIDYISKPFSPPLLLKRIEVHLLVESQKRKLQDYNDNLQDIVKEKTKTVFELQNALFKTIAELVEFRDDVTGGHIERTCEYLEIFINALLRDSPYKEEVLSWDLEFLLKSAQLHDVGKIAIKDNILQKPGKLTTEEFDEMKNHTIYGVNVIKKIGANARENSFLHQAEIFAGTHHEKWNGKGYPLGLSGTDIPLQGRIMAIVDVYDALTNERPYKKAIPHEEAVEIIKNDSGTHFDPHLVDIFIAHENEFKNITIF